MNFTLIAGHLGADPEERATPSGQKVTTLRVATHTRKGGQDATIWWKVTVWGDRFDKMMPYLKKGSPVMISGEMSKPEIYTNKEGQPQIALELVANDIRFSPFGRPDKGGSEEAAPGQFQQKGQMHGKPQAGMRHDELAEDEIPF